MKTQFPSIEELLKLAATELDLNFYVESLNAQLVREQEADERENAAQELASLKSFYGLPDDTPRELVMRYHKNAMNNGASQAALELRVLEDAISSSPYSVYMAADSNMAAFIRDWANSMKSRSKNKGRTL